MIEGLRNLHKDGLVHRDLNPGNIFLSEWYFLISYTYFYLFLIFLIFIFPRDYSAIPPTDLGKVTTATGIPFALCLLLIQ
jgi:serine/threonine protein kinase